MKQNTYRFGSKAISRNSISTDYGTKQKISAKGDTYGWPATAYSTVEKWAGKELISKAQCINTQDAMDEIIERIKRFSQYSELKKIKRFAGL